MDILIYIKRLVLAGKFAVTFKATCEMAVDGLSEEEVLESIVYAHRISKVLNSTSIFRSGSREKLYIIKGKSLSGTVLYTKGAIRHDAEGDVFYVLISSKRWQ